MIVFAMAKSQSSHNLMTFITGVFVVSSCILLFLGLIFRAWAEVLAELTPGRDFKYLENWRAKLLRTQNFLDKNEAFILWLRDFSEATEEVTGAVWDKERTVGTYPPSSIRATMVRTGISAVLHKLGVANKCVTVERPREPDLSDKPTNEPAGGNSSYHLVPVFADSWLQYVERLMQEAACILVSMKTMTPGLEIELKKILEINAVAKTLVIGPRKSIVKTIASNFKVVDCEPYYLSYDRVSKADELKARARTNEGIIEGSLREWLQGKIEVPDASIFQAAASQVNETLMRGRSQLEALGAEGILGNMPERWREVKPPSISLSRAVLMISQKIGHRLWPRG